MQTLSSVAKAFVDGLITTKENCPRERGSD